MKQKIAIAGLVLAVALTGCSPAKVAAKELAAQLGTGTDDVSQWLAKNADAAGASVDDTATHWKTRIGAAPRATGIPRNFATETACGTLSSILFTERAEEPLTVSEVLETLVKSMVPASGTPYGTYKSLKSDVEEINERMAARQPVYLELVVLRQTYCAVLLAS